MMYHYNTSHKIIQTYYSMVIMYACEGAGDKSPFIFCQCTPSSDGRSPNWHKCQTGMCDDSASFWHEFQNGASQNWHHCQYGIDANLGFQGSGPVQAPGIDSGTGCSSFMFWAQFRHWAPHIDMVPIWHHNVSVLALCKTGILPTMDRCKTGTNLHTLWTWVCSL